MEWKKKKRLPKMDGRKTYPRPLLTRAGKSCVDYPAHRMALGMSE